jgi:hypothetical protein
MRPYIITEDLQVLMSRWTKLKGFTLPSNAFFKDLQNELINYLGTIFEEIILVPEADLTGKLREMTRQIKGTTVVSIDQVYNKAKFNLQSNRVVDLDTMKIIGEAQRPGFPPLISQIKKLPRDKHLTLADDGCYTGKTFLKIYDLILEMGFQIQNIIVGVLIDRPKNCLLQKYPNIIIEAAFEYGPVVDWICERDFLIGVPLSGRTAGKRENDGVKPCNPEIALPYCKPMGDPINGASIPTDKDIGFSIFIIKLGKKLWEEIERVSKRPVMNSDIPRLPKSFKRSGKIRFVASLEEKLTELRHTEEENNNQ